MYAAAFKYPAADVIKEAEILQLTGGNLHIRMLFVVLVLRARIRRISQHKRTLPMRKDVVPIHTQCVTRDDVWRRRQRESVNRLTENFAGLQIHLVVHQPEGDFGNAHRPFEKFYAVKLIDVHGRKELLPSAANRELADDIDFEKAQFAIREYEKISAAARRIEELQ